MAKRDYYDVLGVSRGASDADLKKAYRRLAMKFHPDRNLDDARTEEKFKEAKEAYDILSDRQKRAAYDQFGHAGVEAGGSGFADGRGFRDIFDEVFGDIFGGRGGGQRVYRGTDLRYELELGLEEAVAGKKARISFPSEAVCETCSGSRTAPGTSPSTCATCGGQGQVRVQQGFFSIQQTCPRCHGAGSIITDPCGECRGRGKVRREKTLSVTIPPGVDTGDRIRIRGEGAPGERGGPPGDLYVEVQVREHPIFVRDGTNLYCEVPIGFPMAALGGDIEVPTLDGRLSLKIPPETQTGKLFRVRGKGVRSARGPGPGDLICKVTVETPVNLGKRQKELLRELDESMKDSRKTHDPRATSWLDSVKEFFEDLRA